MKLSEEKLIRACLLGKKKYQRALYEKYKVKLFMICLRYAAGRMEAEDFLQEGFIKIFRDLHQFNPERGSLSGWMQQVVRNTIFEHFRRKRIKLSPVPPEDLTEQFMVQEDIFSTLHLQELTALIQNLPPGYRTVFNMYIIDGYSHQEIAEVLGISVNTSKTQLFKAKKMLRGQLQSLSLHITR